MSQDAGCKRKDRDDIQAKVEAKNIQPEIKKLKTDDDELLIFIVPNGKKYRTTRGQIQKHAPADSLIARMIDPDQQMQVKDENGHFKLEYESKNYSNIFLYLRTGTYELYTLEKSFEDNEQFRIDFDYFQLPLPCFWTAVHRLRSQKLKNEEDVEKIAHKFALILISEIFTMIDFQQQRNSPIPSDFVFQLFKQDENALKYELYYNYPSNCVCTQRMEFFRLDWTEEMAKIFKSCFESQNLLKELMERTSQIVQEKSYLGISSITVSYPTPLKAKLDVKLNPMLV